ncbi:MAG TPA: CATRA system-associated protein [Mycobacterium sp.]|jgi:hypothetical protein|uniref:CATRA system-associated protein n=1 Tax=Mycobacterium sp. TaxID=1785 RepID=UPI002F40012E
MAGGLPADLVEETALTLSSVGRVSLPPEQWPVVQLTLRAADQAVNTDDAGALRNALDELGRMGLTPPRSYASPPAGAGPVSFGPIPAPPPGMGAPPPRAARARRRWVWLGTGAFAVAALFAIALLGPLNTRAPNAAGPHSPPTPATMTGLPSGTGAPLPTSASPTESTTGTPTSTGAAGGIFIAVGLIAIAALVIAVVAVLVQRRSRASHALPRPPANLAGVAESTERPERPVFTFAPNELVELANRTVDRLVAKGGGP